MHTAENDRVRVGLRRDAGQRERIAGVVRDILDFWDLIVVSQNNGVPLGLQPLEFRQVDILKHEKASYQQVGQSKEV